MRWQKKMIGTIVFLSVLSFSCQKKPTDSNTLPPVSPNTEAPTEDTSIAPPFATKEPEKYSAKIVFAFQYDQAASDFIEQTYFVARDGAKRRLDFESGDKQISTLETATGAQLILLPKQKVYVELNLEQQKNDARALTNQPEDFSLERLLSVKPDGATFARIGEEEILNRKTTKYQLNFNQLAETENIRTQTFVWADETLGLPIRTEVIAIENGAPTGAKNTVELREIKTEADAEIFNVPSGFRKITFQEARQILGQK